MRILGFADVDMEVTPVILLEGILTKKSRQRSTLAFIKNATWKSRMVLLFSNKTLQYWDGDVLKGDIMIGSAMVCSIDKHDAEEQENAFEVTNSNGDNILFAAATKAIANEWIYKINTVIHNTWKIDIKMREFSQLFSLPKNKYFTFDEAYNKSDLLMQLSSVGGAWRYEYIYYEEYFDTLITRIKQFFRIVTFEETFLSTFHAHKIRIRPSTTLAEKGKSFQTSVSGDGILLIEFQSGMLQQIQPHNEVLSFVILYL